jgi:hypothetical protein
MASDTGFPCHVTVPETFAMVGCQQPDADSRMTKQAATHGMALARS